MLWSWESPCNCLVLLPTCRPFTAEVLPLLLVNSPVGIYKQRFSLWYYPFLSATNPHIRGAPPQSEGCAGTGAPRLRLAPPGSAAGALYMSSNLLAMKSASKQTDCAFEAGRINLLQLIETLKTVIFCSARFCQCSFKLKSLEEKKNNNNNNWVRYRYYDQQRLSSLF